MILNAINENSECEARQESNVMNASMRTYAHKRKGALRNHNHDKQCEVIELPNYFGWKIFSTSTRLCSRTDRAKVFLQHVHRKQVINLGVSMCKGLVLGGTDKLSV